MESTSVVSQQLNSQQLIMEAPMQLDIVLSIIDSMRKVSKELLPIYSKLFVYQQSGQGAVNEEDVQMMETAVTVLKKKNLTSVAEAVGFFYEKIAQQPMEAEQEPEVEMEPDLEISQVVRRASRPSLPKPTPPSPPHFHIPADWQKEVPCPLSTEAG